MKQVTVHPNFITLIVLDYGAIIQMIISKIQSVLVPVSEGMREELQLNCPERIETHDNLLPARKLYHNASTFVFGIELV